MSKYLKSLIIWTIMMSVLILFAWTMIRYCQERVGRIESRDQLALAIIAEGKSQIDEAIAHYTAALRYQPSAIAPRKGLIQLFMRKGDFEKALSHGRDMLRYADENERVDALLMLGNTYEQMALWNEARRAYEEAITLQPERAEIFAGLARATASLRDYSAMIKSIENIRKGEEGSCSAAFIVRQNHCRDIIARMREKIRTGENMGNSYYRLGSATLETGGWVDACQAFLESLKYDDAPGDAAFYLGVDAQVKQDNIAAISFYQEALRRAPAHMDAMRNLLQLKIESMHSLPGSDSAFKVPEQFSGSFQPTD